MVFPKIGVPQNEWLRMENLIKMDDLVSFPIIFGNTIFFSNDKDTFFWDILFHMEWSGFPENAELAEVECGWNQSTKTW